MLGKIVINQPVDILELKQKRFEHYILSKCKKNAYEENKSEHNLAEWKKEYEIFLMYNSVTPLTTHLVNLKNTCYISSVVQALAASLKTFKSILKQDETLLSQLLLEMQKPNTTTVKLSKKGGIYERFVTHVRSRFANGYGMFDADELLLALIDDLKNTSKLFDIEYVIDNFNKSGKPILQQHKQKNRQYQMIPEEDGSFKYDSLEIYFKNNKLRVDNLEKITDESTPPKTYYNAKQYTHYDMTENKILVIHVQRFSYDAKINQIIKNNDVIDYPLSFSSSLINSTSSHMYTLKAFIEHEGKYSDTGHYLTYAKYGSQWWMFDDLKITPTPVDNINLRNPYILIYVACDK